MAGNPITALRTGVADMLRAVGDDIPVFDGWPANVSAPCLVVHTGRGENTSRCVHQVETLVTCVAPGGDNTASQSQLDSLVNRVVGTLNSKGPVRVDWDQPTTTVISNSTYYTTVCRMTADISL